MKLLPFLSILFLSICACTEQQTPEEPSTETRSQHHQEDNGGITITIDTTLQDTISYTF